MERRRPLVLIVESVRVLKLVNLFAVDNAGGSPTFVQLDIAEETVRENEELLREVVVVDDVHLTQVFRDINPTVYIVGITTGEEVNELEMIAAGANTTMVNVVDEVRMTEILQNLPAPAPAPGPKLSTVASKANVYSGPYLSLSLEEERTQICCRLNQIPYPSSSSGLVGLLVEKLCVENFMLYDESDLKLDVFLVQHDMENMYMWVFKERPENALGKMQPMRSYMNGHSKARHKNFVEWSGGWGRGDSRRRSSGTTSRLGACSRGGKGGSVCDNRSGQRSSAIRRGGETNARHDGGLRIDTVKKRPETSCSTSRTDTEYTSSQCRTTTRSGRGMAVMPPELLA
ncbi:BnaA04g21580D [Brassica napus]|uniref:(rape) hypothetical protein n=1 Tax=Brassica napus TaxID=3708 RepID=A0A078FZ04_BRANA|nr:unnamed protein product [Brassica napus]CDY18429.1 BnaA04g21580D [Brassica napus]